MTSRDATDIGSPGPQGSPGFLLWRTTLRWQRSVTAALRPLALTHVQFVLLANVWWLSGPAVTVARPPTQRQVAGHAAVDVMMTSQVLRALEARGLVRRGVDPADGRVRLVSVTDEGRRLAERAVAVVEEADALFFARAHPQQLLEVLHQLDTEIDPVERLVPKVTGG